MTKLEELSDGVVFAQLLGLIYSNSIKMEKFNRRTHTPLEKAKNLKILSVAMYTLGLDKAVNVFLCSMQIT